MTVNGVDKSIEWVIESGKKANSIWLFQNQYFNNFRKKNVIIEVV